MLYVGALMGQYENAARIAVAVLAALLLLAIAYVAAGDVAVVVVGLVLGVVVGFMLVRASARS